MTEHLCRACLSEDTLTSLFTKWTNDGTAAAATAATTSKDTINLTYFDCFNLCTNLRPTINCFTQLPARICSKCLRELRAAYLFWSKCQRSEEELMQRWNLLEECKPNASIEDTLVGDEQQPEPEYVQPFKDEPVVLDKTVATAAIENATDESGKLLIEVLDVQEDEDDNLVYSDDVIFTSAQNEYELKDLNAIDVGGDASSSSPVPLVEVEEMPEPIQQQAESGEYETCYLEVEDGGGGGNEECGEYYQCDYCDQGFGK